MNFQLILKNDIAFNKEQIFADIFYSPIASIVSVMGEIDIESNNTQMSIQYSNADTLDYNNSSWGHTITINSGDSCVVYHEPDFKADICGVISALCKFYLSKKIKQ